MAWGACGYRLLLAEAGMSAQVHLFWQDDLVHVSKPFCECLDVTLGADSDDQRQTPYQP